jgi:Fe-S-cluster-containing hydrogenase component 2
MEAVSMPEIAEVDLTRCIGCGLCVSTCPVGAMKLVAKAEVDVPARSTEALYTRIYRERYGTAALAKAALKLAARARV